MKICNFKIDTVFHARLPSIFSTSHKMPRLPRNLHLVTTSRSPDNAIRTKRAKTRLKCCHLQNVKTVPKTIRAELAWSFQTISPFFFCSQASQQTAFQTGSHASQNSLTDPLERVCSSRWRLHLQWTRVASSKFAFCIIPVNSVKPIAQIFALGNLVAKTKFGCWAWSEAAALAHQTTKWCHQLQSWLVYLRIGHVSSINYIFALHVMLPSQRHSATKLPSYEQLRQEIGQGKRGKQKTRRSVSFQAFSLWNFRCRLARYYWQNNFPE